MSITRRGGVLGKALPVAGMFGAGIIGSRIITTQVGKIVAEKMGPDSILAKYPELAGVGIVVAAGLGLSMASKKLGTALLIGGLADSAVNYAVNHFNIPGLSGLGMRGLGYTSQVEFGNRPLLSGCGMGDMPAGAAYAESGPYSGAVLQ